MMGGTALLVGLLPLIVFVIIDSFASLRVALAAAICFAFAEALFSYFYFGELDWITAGSFVLIVVFAIVSFYTKSALHFKLQPAILSAVFGLFFLYTSYVMHEPFIVAAMLKYKDALPEQMQAQIENVFMQAYLAKASDYMGFAFLGHALVTGWAAVKMSKWWWLTIRGVGFYLFMFFAMFAARLSMLNQ